MIINTEHLSCRQLDVKLKTPRSNFGSIYLQSKLYICGGFNGKENLNSFEVFEKENKCWIDLPKMLSRRKEFSMVLGINKNIYVLGGSDDKE